MLGKGVHARATTDSKRFAPFFQQPKNKKWFDLHKTLRVIFTSGSNKSAKTINMKASGTVSLKTKKLPADMTVELRWLPEKDLHQNLSTLRSFVRFLSRALSNPSDPTLRTINLQAKPYNDVLKGTRFQNHAKSILRYIGFQPQGEVMVLDNLKMHSFERGLQEIDYFINRLAKRLKQAADERKVQCTEAKTTEDDRNRENTKHEALGSLSRLNPPSYSPIGNLNATSSVFKVMNSGYEDREVQDEVELGLVGDVRPGSVVENKSRKLSLKHRPVHYTVSNMRRRRSLEAMHPRISEGKFNKYVEREADARRRLQTSSTFHVNHAAGKKGLFTNFMLRPNAVSFGHLRPGFLYGFNLALKNQGNQTGRYVVIQPRLSREQHNMMRIVHKPGPVASGMSAQVEVQLWAGAIGDFTDTIHIQTETTEHELVVTASIRADAQRLPRARSTTPGHVRLVSRRMPVTFERLMDNSTNQRFDEAPFERKVRQKDHVVPEPTLPNFESTFKPGAHIEPLSKKGIGSAGVDNVRHRASGETGDDAGPIPDADEATAAKSNKALEAKMLESMKMM